MKRFSLLISLAAAVVWLLPVVGPFAGPAGASVITTGDVDPGGAATQPDPWAVRGILTVGYGGSGTLNVLDGGVIPNATGYIGHDSGSTGTATITGANSQWNNSNNLYVGRYGTGTLNVMDGGVVANLNGHIGEQSNSTGMATVSGSGSKWNNVGSLSVGLSGTGTLTVEDGGEVSNTFRLPRLLRLLNRRSDGDVDGDDFLLWQRNFPVLDGTAGSSSGDGNVDGDDFLV